MLVLPKPSERGKLWSLQSLEPDRDVPEQAGEGRSWN